MRDIYKRLNDIQEAIDHIEKYTREGRESFDQNELVQIWVIHHLEIIGEAVRAIPQDFRRAHPEIPWAEINRMRNILIHMYFGINRNLVWKVVEYDLPPLKAHMETILNKE